MEEGSHIQRSVFRRELEGPSPGGCFGRMTQRRAGGHGRRTCFATGPAAGRKLLFKTGGPPTHLPGTGPPPPRGAGPKSVRLRAFPNSFQSFASKPIPDLRPEPPSPQGDPPTPLPPPPRLLRCKEAWLGVQRVPRRQHCHCGLGLLGVQRRHEGPDCGVVHLRQRRGGDGGRGRRRARVVRDRPGIGGEGDPENPASGPNPAPLGGGG